MAASRSIEWTVMILVDYDCNLNRAYQMSPSTTLADLLDIWMDELQLFEHWVFKSTNEKTTYENTMTLESIGETIPNTKLITLRAEIAVSELFVNVENQCHHVYVSPNLKLCEVMWPLSRESATYEHNSSSLSLMKTVSESGLQHRAVIHESSCLITVELSLGDVQIFRVPANSRVGHLMMEVRLYEAEDFALSYKGRYLHPQEGVRELKQVVKVTKAVSVVYMNNCNEKLLAMIAESPIEMKNIDRKIDGVALGSSLTCSMANICMMHFEAEATKKVNQHFIIMTLYTPEVLCKCVELKESLSATLDVGTQSENGTRIKQIMGFHGILIHVQAMELGTKSSRVGCKNVKGKLLQEGTDYNIINRLWEKNIDDLGDQKKTLEVTIDILDPWNVKSLTQELTTEKKRNVKLVNGLNKLKDKKGQLVEGIRTLKCKNRKSEEELEALRAENKSLVEAVRKLKARQRACDTEIKTLRHEKAELEEAMNVKAAAWCNERSAVEAEKLELEAEISKLNVQTCDAATNATNALKSKNAKLEHEMKIWMAMNEKKENDNKALIAANRNMKRALDTSVNDREEAMMINVCFGSIIHSLKKELGVKLLIFYDSNYFTFIPFRSQTVRQTREGWNYDECRTNLLQPGWESFTKVRKALQQFFVRSSTWTSSFFGGEIRMIKQRQKVLFEGSGMFVEVFSDSVQQNKSGWIPNTTVLGNGNGDSVTVLSGIEPREIREGGQIFICGGDQITVLAIFR